MADGWVAVFDEEIIWVKNLKRTRRCVVDVAWEDKGRCVPPAHSNKIPSAACFLVGQDLSLKMETEGREVILLCSGPSK